MNKKYSLKKIGSWIIVTIFALFVCVLLYGLGCFVHELISGLGLISSFFMTGLKCLGILSYAIIPILFIFLFYELLIRSINMLKGKKN